MEFALLLPAFMLIVLGIFDLGRIIYSISALHHGAREGARYAAVNHCDTAGIVDVAKYYTIGLSDAVNVTTQTEYDLITGFPERIEVMLDYDFRTVTPLVGVFLGDDQVIKLTSLSNKIIELRVDCSVMP